MCMYIYIYIYAYIYIYIYIYTCNRTAAGARQVAALGHGLLRGRVESVLELEDGRVRFEPGVSNIIYLILHVSKLVIWGSILGRGFRFHWLIRAAIRPGRTLTRPAARPSRTRKQGPWCCPADTPRRGQRRSPRAPLWPNGTRRTGST